MNKIKSMFPHLILTAIAFYGLPFLGKDTGLSILMLLVAIPLACFVSSMMYGIKHGMNFFYPIIVGIMFIPTIFIFFNSSAWVYTIGYAIISFLGNIVGYFLGKPVK